MNLFKLWSELPSEEKISVFMMLSFVLAAVVIVLYAFLASRGQDIEYFKHRLGLIEQRINYMDQKVDKVLQTQHDQKEHFNEIRRQNEAYQRAIEDQQRWIEHWKTLPQLPKPPQGTLKR